MTAPADPATSASGAPEAQRRLITSSGGNVLAECAGREVVVISWTPAQGYRVDDVDLEARSDVEVRFEGEDTESRSRSGVPMVGPSPRWTRTTERQP